MYKVYFFNVSNPDDVQRGAKPIVKEIGPYVYTQYRTKLDITRADDILSYYQYQHFEFDEEASAPLTQTDPITIVNLPLMSVATIAEYYTGESSLGLKLFDSTIPTIFDEPSSIFTTTTPKEFLFDGVYLMCNSLGFVTSIICNIIGTYAPKMMTRVEDGRFRFSFYGYKNATRGDYYSMNDGMFDIDQLGDIVAWENSSTVNTWSEDGNCNKIHGSDGGTFPPFRTTQSVLHHFNTDICRAVSASYSRKITYSGIETNRYEVDETTFTSPSNYSENSCFCLNRTKGITGDDGCLLDGGMELWECQGAPVVISMPHFYLANEIYQNGVDGLKPDKSLHTMFLDVEPMSGVLLHAAKKAQVNIFIRPIDQISLTANLPTALMPVLWMDESYKLNDEFVDLLNSNLFDVLGILSTVKWCTLIAGLILFSFGWIWLLRSIWGPTQFMKLV